MTDLHLPTKIMNILRNRYHYDQLRPLQLEVIKGNISEANGIILIPTGIGKSLTFTLPTILKETTYLIISPLCSLINDQVIHANKFKIKCKAYYNKVSTKDFYLVENVDKSLHTFRQLRLIYITPEKLQNEVYQNCINVLITEGIITRVIVDECHVVNIWGSGFRPACLTSLEFLNNIEGNKIPFSFYTGTLHLHDKNFLMNCGKNERGFFQVQGDLFRPNLHIFSIDMDNISNTIDDHKLIAINLLRVNAYNLTNEQLLQREAIVNNTTMVNSDNCRFQLLVILIKSLFIGRFGIIYCNTIATTARVQKCLIYNGITNFSIYHGEENKTIKSTILELWMNLPIETNNGYIIIATTAFGMGIDKANVDFIINFNMLSSISDYIQCNGRSGRSGQNSYCIQFFSFNDYKSVKTMNSTMNNDSVNKKEKNRQIAEVYNLYLMLQNKSTCRHKLEIDYMKIIDPMFECNTSCDNCLKFQYPLKNQVVKQNLYINFYMNIIIIALKLLQTKFDCYYVRLDLITYYLTGRINPASCDSKLKNLYDLPNFGILSNCNDLTMNAIYKEAIGNIGIMQLWLCTTDQLNCHNWQEREYIQLYKNLYDEQHCNFHVSINDSILQNINATLKRSVMNGFVINNMDTCIILAKRSIEEYIKYIFYKQVKIIIARITKMLQIEYHLLRELVMTPKLFERFSIETPMIQVADSLPIRHIMNDDIRLSFATLILNCISFYKNVYIRLTDVNHSDLYLYNNFINTNICQLELQNINSHVNNNNNTILVSQYIKDYRFPDIRDPHFAQINELHEDRSIEYLNEQLIHGCINELLEQRERTIITTNALKNIIKDRYTTYRKENIVLFDKLRYYTECRMNQISPANQLTTIEKTFIINVGLHCHAFDNCETYKVILPIILHYSNEILGRTIEKISSWNTQYYPIILHSIGKVKYYTW